MAKGRKTGGRQRGTPNKATKDIREAWMEAVAVAQGTEGMSLSDWAVRDAEANQKFWLATMQMVPKNVDVTSGGNTLADLLTAVAERAREQG